MVVDGNGGRWLLMGVDISGCQCEWRSVVVDGSGGQWLLMGVEVSGCQWEWM